MVMSLKERLAVLASRYPRQIWNKDGSGFVGVCEAETAALRIYAYVKGDKIKVVFSDVEY